MNRRTVLTHLTAAGGLALAGCSSLPGSGDTRPVLGRIQVLNSSLVSNRIRLLVVRDEETLLDRELTLAAIDAEAGTRAAVIEPSWGATPGEYTIHANHIDESGDRESSSWEYTVTQQDYDRYYPDEREDPGCLGVVVTIGSLSENANAAIGIGPTYMEDPCGSLTTGDH
jgi:hypothetical protein